jgi:glycosyltransferase involved in cell wall biosynthesis
MLQLSIITINYNNASGLKKTIDSVVQQSFKDIEYIVIDGGSSDESKSIIEQNTNAINFWVSEKDNGIYDAMNKGIQHASGEYILFLNSGDCLYNENVLKTAIPYFKSKKAIYYGNLILETNKDKVEHFAPHQINLDFLLNSTFWHPCTFIQSQLFKQFGHYNTDFKICGDYEFFIRCLIHPNIETEYLNQFITLFDGNGISNNKTFEMQQTNERELAWQINLSPIIIDSIKSQNAFRRSKYANVIQTIQKLRGKQNF